MMYLYVKRRSKKKEIKKFQILKTGKSGENKVRVTAFGMFHQEIYSVLTEGMYVPIIKKYGQTICLK